MSEYWKAIPKIYCKFCNVWYQDNKASKDNHERSFKHKGNITRHIIDVQKKGREQQKEEDIFKREMLRIEQAAMTAYQKDLANNPSSTMTKPTSSFTQQRIEIKQEENDNLRKEALDAVTNKLKRKHEWFECKTVEGKIYYYNRLTMETKWTEPKNGFVSIGEQWEMDVSDVPGDQSKASEEDGRQFKHEQFNSSWQQVASKDAKIDLQLPKFKVKKKLDANLDKRDDDEIIEFKEKVLELTVKKKKDQGFGFKKRKLNASECRRVKTDD